MYDENIVLCAASAYDRKYYLSRDFDGLPDSIKDELKIMCVLFTEEAGGIITLEFDEDGNLMITTDADEGDLLYDEIGSVLMVKQMRRDHRDLFESLELYYRVYFLGEVLPDDE